MGTFLAGASTIDITPPIGVELAGYSKRQAPATGIHDRLQAAAVVFDDRRQKSAICSVDVLGVQPFLVEAVRRRVSYLTSMKPERIMIVGTHTHSAPRLRAPTRANQVWVKELEDALVQVLVEADYYRQEGRLGAATGAVAGIGGNRRDPEHGLVDPAVQVVAVEHVESGRQIAVLVGHACHATVLGADNLEVSADFPGQLRRYLRDELSGEPAVLFLNGACGDINPGGYSAEAAGLGKSIPGRTFERCAEIGEQLGREVVRLLTTIEPRGPLRVESGSAHLELPLKQIPLPAEAEERRAAAERKLAESPGEEAELELFYATIHAGQANRFYYAPNQQLEADVQGMSVGDIVFVGCPGEVFVELGQSLKQRSPFGTTFIVGYANDEIGYFPTPDALASGSGYEVLVSLVGQVAIARFTEATGRLTEELHDRQQASDTKAAEPQIAVKPNLLVPQHLIERAKFPAIDSHVHYFNAWQRPEQVLADMEAANVHYCVNMVGDRFPQARLEPVLPLWASAPERFIPYAGLDFSRIDEPDWASYIEEKLDHDANLGSRGLKIYKELGLLYTDSRGDLILPDDPRLAPVWTACAERQIPVLYHIGDPPPFFEPLTPANERYDSLKNADKWYWGAPGFPTHEQLTQCMFRLAEQNPQTIFIFPHCGALTHDLRRLGEFMGRCPNVYTDLSARLDLLARQPYTAREFILAFPERILWGSDDIWPNRNGVYKHWFRFLETYDEYWGIDSYYGKPAGWRFYGIGLPDDALRAVYGATAARLLKLDWPES